MSRSPSYFVATGLSRTENKATAVLQRLQPHLADAAATSPSAYLQQVWQAVESLDIDRSTRGTVFELLIGTILVARGIAPIYLQAEVRYVNNARFDLLLWESGERPISLSLKTSLRERYKQADMEAWALKSVHRGALNYLITLDHEAVQGRLRRIKAREEYSAIDEWIVATGTEFDRLVERLRSMTFAEPKPQSPMVSQVVARQQQ
jgi:hypothetical protein